MSELNYINACQINGIEQELVIKTDCILPIYQSFVSNIGLAAAVLNLPGFFVNMGDKWRCAIEEAEAMDKEKYGNTPAPPFDPRWQSLQMAADDIFLDLCKRQAEATGFSDHALATHNAVLFTRHHPSGEAVIIKLLHAAIIQVWTAFETMAADLWEAAVNAHPAELAKLCGSWTDQEMQEQKKARREAERTAPLGEAIQKSDKPVSAKMMKLEYLEARNFDVSSVMGTIWRSEARYNFQILASIQEAYVNAFATDNAGIRDAILSPALSDLAEVRNILVHKAGIVDVKFLDKMKDRGFGTAQVDQPLSIDGTRVRDVIDAAVTVSKSLLSSVDNWLSSH